MTIVLDSVSLSKEARMAEKKVGQTESAGFQAGARRTYDLSPAEAWELLVSARGAELLVGRAVPLEPAGRGGAWEGEPVAYAITTFSPGSHLRMRWSLPGWTSHSILQLRILPASGGRATVSIHQERLAGPAEREAMLERWEAFHSRLGSLADRTGEARERGGRPDGLRT
jgi:hypothetical protein